MLNGSAAVRLAPLAGASSPCERKKIGEDAFQGRARPKAGSRPLATFVCPAGALGGDRGASLGRRRTRWVVMIGRGGVVGERACGGGERRLGLESPCHVGPASAGGAGCNG